MTISLRWGALVRRVCGIRRQAVYYVPRLEPPGYTVLESPTDVLAVRNSRGCLTMTHGRQGWSDAYPWWLRAFVRWAPRPYRVTQWIFPGMTLLILNLSNAPTRIASVAVPPYGGRLVRLPSGPQRLMSATPFNYYVVTEADGVSALQHVK